jgi:FkbM family methyltransferase
MNFFYGLRNYHSLFGSKGVFLALKSRAVGETMYVAVSIPDVRFPLHLRLRNSDVTLLRSIFLDGEYDWSFREAPRVIVDAGANVGFTSVMFANRYPRARIIAIEPEASNFKLLQKNASCYPQIEVLQAALWKENTKLRIRDPGGGHWAFRMEEASTNGPLQGDPSLADAYTLEKILADRQINYVDLLKMDIEGSEREIFESSSAWIERVGIIAVELHDSFKPGCREAFHRATEKFEFEWIRGETTIRGRQDFGGSKPSLFEEFESRRARLNSLLPFQTERTSLD